MNCPFTPNVLHLLYILYDEKEVNVVWKRYLAEKEAIKLLNLYNFGQCRPFLKPRACALMVRKKKNAGFLVNKHFSRALSPTLLISPIRDTLSCGPQPIIWRHYRAKGPQEHRRTHSFFCAARWCARFFANLRRLTNPAYDLLWLYPGMGKNEQWPQLPPPLGQFSLEPCGVYTCV